MNIISLKIMKDSNISKYISIIRKATGQSISDIKRAIENNDYAVESDYYDSDELNTLVITAEALVAIGAKLEIYEDDRETTIQMVKNLINTYEEIEEEREEMDDITHGDE